MSQSSSSTNMLSHKSVQSTYCVINAEYIDSQQSILTAQIKLYIHDINYKNLDIILKTYQQLWHYRSPTELWYKNQLITDDGFNYHRLYN